MKADLSIIVLTWNDKPSCLVCIEALDKIGRIGRPDTEVIVVDNGSIDGTADEVAARYPSVAIHRNDANRGTSARNAGILLAHGDNILLLDDDTLVQPDAVERMIETLGAPSAGIVGPRLTDTNGRLQYTCRLFPTIRGKLARRLKWRLFEPFAIEEELQTWDHANRRDVDYMIGACWLVRRAVFDEIGLFDEAIFYGGEDIDLCMRARLGGWRVVYEPAAHVVHRERRITSGAPFSPMMRKHMRDLVYVFWKHRYFWSRSRVYERIRRTNDGAARSGASL